MGTSRENFDFFKMGAFRKNLSSKWVHQEKTFLKNGCIQRKLFLKMDASRENLSSKLMHQDKTLLQNGCIKSLSFTKFRKRIIMFFKVSLHVIKVSLLMWFSLSLITSQSKLSLNSEANAADQWKDPFLVRSKDLSPFGTSLVRIFARLWWARFGQGEGFGHLSGSSSPIPLPLANTLEQVADGQKKRKEHISKERV